MEFLLLGPMVAYRGSETLDLGRRSQRLLLGLLLLETGRPVQVDRLVSLLWADEPPTNAQAILQTHVSRLRRLLDPDRDGRYGFRLRTHGSAYQADITPDRVDVHRFRTLVDQGLALPDPAARIGALRAALRLWRGPLLADVVDHDLRHRIGAGVEELRLTALEACGEAELTAGRHRQMIAGLTDLVADHPTRESLVAQLMLALYRDGRGPDALDLYHRTRQTLASTIGVDPGPRIQQLYHAMLRARPELLLPVAGPVASAVPVRPAQLPAGPVPFVGRSGELSTLDRVLAPDGRAAVPTAVLVGTAGAGKTALALHWAHRARGRYPDGQLYLNLNGYAAAPPVRPADALARFLRSLGVAAEGIPADPDEAAALYRTLLADRRVLVLLDNAATVDQVRPLLPGGSSCAVVVTSRHSLGGLVASAGAVRVAVPMLDPEAAYQLLGLIVGEQRVVADPTAAVEVVGLCAHLPLAVRIVAAKLAEEEDRPLAGYAEELRTAHRLAVLEDADDQQAGVRVAFTRSYLALPAPSRRLFRLLGTLPGTDFPADAVAALADAPVGEVRRRLGALVDAHLVTALDADRYALHDLLRLFARERIDAEEPARERDAAVAQVLTWYRDAANAADRVLRPRERPSFASDARPVEFPDEAAALAWLEREATGLLSAVEAAAEPHPRLAWQIAAAMYGWLSRRYQRSGWIALYLIAAEAAVRAGDAAGEALIVGRMAIAHALLGQTDEAIAGCRRAYRLRSGLGDRLGAATALLNLAAAQLNDRRPEQAIETLDAAIAEADGVPGSEHFTTLVRSNLAEAHHLAGRPAEAVRHYELALAASTTGSGKRDQAQILIGLADVCLGTGEVRRAIELAERGMRLADDTGDVVLGAEARERLGRGYAALGEVRPALDRLYQALVGYEQVGHRDTAALRTRVAGLNDSATAPA